MTEKIEIIDTLVELGGGTIDLENNTQRYTYLEFKNSGRIHNVQIFRSADSKLHSTINLTETKFIFIKTADVVSKKIESYLIAFQTPEGKTYTIDFFGEIHPEFSKKYLAAGIFTKIMIFVGVLLFIIGLPLILFFFSPGLIAFAIGGAAIFYGMKASKELNKFKKLSKSITNSFPNAIEL